VCVPYWLFLDKTGGNSSAHSAGYNSPAGFPLEINSALFQRPPPPRTGIPGKNLRSFPPTRRFYRPGTVLPCQLRLRPCQLRFPSRNRRSARCKAVSAGARFVSAGARFVSAGARFACAGARFASVGARFACAGARFACAGARFVSAGARSVSAGARFVSASARFVFAGASRFLRVRGPSQRMRDTSLPRND
jgi:hypothetical protein